MQRLNLDENQINEIEGGAFDKLENLTDIWLYKYYLTKIHEGLFKACDQVLLLDLENNTIISSIKFVTLELLKLYRDINIQNNVFSIVRIFIQPRSRK